ncbi:MAG: response regulator [Sphingobacteriales bacterium]|nr:MAG: response regulator [Sphingobacteriales bacterium]
MNPHTVLWADDDPDDLFIYNEAVSEIDNKVVVTPVHNGRELIDYLNEVKPHDGLPAMIVMDMNMPLVNGREALALIKKDESLSRIPLVVFTTSNSSVDAMFCLQHEVMMVTKPCLMRQIKEVIREILQLRWRGY